MKFGYKIMLGVVMLLTVSCNIYAETLKIAYSDWPGWIAWDIAQRKGFFKQHGVEVELKWFEYMASMDAFAAGKVDAVCVANGDALVLSASGAKNIMILVNDFSNGNDKIVAKPGIKTVKDLKGKKIGVELGVVSHLLLINALTENGMTDKDVILVNVPTHQTAQVLASGDVDAIVAWQPNSGQALKFVPGSTAVYTSANAPGLIYDTLTVSPGSLMKHHEDWKKVVAAWYDVVDYMQNPANEKEMLEILSSRVDLKPEEYKPFLLGTKILTLPEALAVFKPADGMGSLYGSSENVNTFFVANKVYTEPVKVKKTIDSSFTKSLSK
ncbi:MAG: ABC transporter substrate-binding protein [Desulfobulbus sp.]|nr:ABC transporter substrate-binding protein [Desulfobulbus sp.]